MSLSTKSKRHPAAQRCVTTTSSISRIAPARSLRNDRRYVPRRPPLADVHGRVSQRLDIDAAMREVSPAHPLSAGDAVFGDMSLSDIAAQLDVPVNTVKTRLFKGKAQLALLLAEPDTPSVMSRE